MKLEIQDSFINKLNWQVAYIAGDKPEVAIKFKNELLQLILKIPEAPNSYVHITSILNLSGT